MTIKDILIFPDPVLAQRSKPVTEFGGELDKLITDMFETMHAAEGIGLAAIQVGVPLRLSVIQVEKPLVIINPKITPNHGTLESSEEGCLSIPDIKAKVQRPTAIRLDYLNPQQEACSLEADGLLSRCIQHEVDHMDGKLFISRISSLARKEIQPKLQQLILKSSTG